jgi:hypothetical protein
MIALSIDLGARLRESGISPLPLHIGHFILLSPQTFLGSYSSDKDQSRSLQDARLGIQDTRADHPFRQP